MGEKIGFGLYQSWRNRGEVGYVSVYWLRWCGWYWGSGSVAWVREGGVKCVFVVRLEYLCRWQVYVSVYCAMRIPALLRCTQCSILLHHINICFLICIGLWQISQIQTCLRVFVRPGFGSTSPGFMTWIQQSRPTHGGTVMQQTMPANCDHLYPVSLLFISAGFLPRVSSHWLN